MVPPETLREMQRQLDDLEARKRKEKDQQMIQLKNDLGKAAQSWAKIWTGYSTEDRYSYIFACYQMSMVTCKSLNLKVIAIMSKNWTPEKVYKELHEAYNDCQISMGTWNPAFFVLRTKEAVDTAYLRPGFADVSPALIIATFWDVIKSETNESKITPKFLKNLTEHLDMENDFGLPHPE